MTAKMLCINEEDGWSGSCLLYKLTATVHLCITSHEHPNLQFLMNSPVQSCWHSF